MKKISLQLDSMRVESFETTSAAAAPRGTVKGHASDSTCFERYCTCDSANPECESVDCLETEAITCGISCTFYCSQTCPANTCAYSCEGTCGCPTWQGETCGIC